MLILMDLTLPWCNYFAFPFATITISSKTFTLDRVALSLLCLLIFLATAHELWLTYNKKVFNPKKVGKALQALNSFSMIENCRKLLSTKSAVVENLGCLNGIRVLSTAWIVLFHTYLTFNTYYVSNRFMFYQVMEDYT